MAQAAGEKSFKACRDMIWGGIKILYYFESYYMPSRILQARNLHLQWRSPKRVIALSMSMLKLYIYLNALKRAAIKWLCFLYESLYRRWCHWVTNKYLLNSNSFCSIKIDNIFTYCFILYAIHYAIWEYINSRRIVLERKTVEIFHLGYNFWHTIQEERKRKRENKVFSCQENFSDVMNHLSDLILSPFLHISSSYVAFITKLIIILSCGGHKTLFGSWISICSL